MTGGCAQQCRAATDREAHTISRSQGLGPAASASAAASAPAPDESPAAENTQGVHPESDQHLDDELAYIGDHLRSRQPITAVKHTCITSLFRLAAFDGLVRPALGGFLKRFKSSKWMKRQQLYVVKAALAAAHMRMTRVIHAYGESGRPLLDTFDGIGFLNCGWSVKSRSGDSFRWSCGRVEYCPRCNFRRRVQPTKDEFLPAFERAGGWYSVTIMGRSDPAKAGVWLEIGRDEADRPILQPLFRLVDHLKCPKFPKFSVDSIWLPVTVAECLHSFARWLVDLRYFDGLHVFRDLSFTFFPHPSSPTGVGHTVNCHYHAYGNSTRKFTPAAARRIWLGYFRCQAAAGCHDGLIYPDIYLRPAATKTDLEAAIDYVIKPFDLAKWYLTGLRNGCSLTGLNLSFHQTCFDAESLFPGDQRGCRFGNLNQKAGHRYIGDPQTTHLSRRQLKRYWERLADGTLTDWEMRRFEKHLALLKRRNFNHEP